MGHRHRSIFYSSCQEWEQNPFFSSEPFTRYLSFFPFYIFLNVHVQITFSYLFIATLIISNLDNSTY